MYIPGERCESYLRKTSEIIEFLKWMFYRRVREGGDTVTQKELSLSPFVFVDEGERLLYYAACDIAVLPSKYERFL